MGFRSWAGLAGSRPKMTARLKQLTELAQAGGLKRPHIKQQNDFTAPKVTSLCRAIETIHGNGAFRQADDEAIQAIVERLPAGDFTVKSVKKNLLPDLRAAGLVTELRMEGGSPVCTLSPLGRRLAGGTEQETAFRQGCENLLDHGGVFNLEAFRQTEERVGNLDLETELLLYLLVTFNFPSDNHDCDETIVAFRALDRGEQAEYLNGLEHLISAHGFAESGGKTSWTNLTNQCRQVRIVLEQLDRTSSGKDGSNDDVGLASVWREIEVRRGQPAFRQEVLRRFDGRCPVTGCECDTVLEAAHIVPWSREKSMDGGRGILLRSDIHTLFDRNLMTIDPTSLKISIAGAARAHYAEYHGKTLPHPRSKSHTRDLRNALRDRLKEWDQHAAHAGTKDPDQTASA